MKESANMKYMSQEKSAKLYPIKNVQLLFKKSVKNLSWKICENMIRTRSTCNQKDVAS